MAAIGKVELWGHGTMSREIVRKLTPEEEELHRKREELAGVRGTLAKRELELADFRAQLKSFEGRYLRQVGVLYAELDDWEAKIATLEARLRPSATASQQAQETRKRADETHEAAHGEASKAVEFKPPADLRKLYYEVAKRIHPDFAKDDGADRLHRNDRMAKANEAYNKSDTEALQRILEEYSGTSESVPGEGIGAELIRIIRQIAKAKEHIAAIEQKLREERAGEIAQLKQDCEAAGKEGRDLLAELAASVRERIADLERKHKTLAVELKNNGG